MIGDGDAGGESDDESNRGTGDVMEQTLHPGDTCGIFDSEGVDGRYGRAMATAPVRPGPPLDRLVAGIATELTATERRLAEVVLADPTCVAFDTVAELARRAGTSGPSVMRFATRLGFDGYSALQRSVRDDLAARLTRPTDRIRSDEPADSDDAARRNAHASIDDVYDRATRDAISEMAEVVASATGHLWIVASEASSPVAHLLTSNLRLVRSGVVQVTGSAAAVAGTIVDAGPDDAVIAVDVERYERSVSDTARLLVERGAVMVAITDGPLAPLATAAAHWCGVRVPSIGPFDSAVPIVAMAELLIAEVAARRRDTATDRLDRAEDAWTALDAFSGGDR